MVGALGVDRVLVRLRVLRLSLRRQTVVLEELLGGSMGAEFDLAAGVGLAEEVPVSGLIVAVAVLGETVVVVLFVIALSACYRAMVVFRFSVSKLVRVRF